MRFPEKPQCLRRANAHFEGEFENELVTGMEKRNNNKSE